MIRAILLFCALLSSGAQAANVDSYTIKVALDEQSQRLSGKQTVKYTNRSNKVLSQLYFLLLANHSKQQNPYLHALQNDQGFWAGWEPNQIDILSVSESDSGTAMHYTLESAPAVFQTFSLDDVLLKITLSTPLQPGESIRIDMGFSTRFVHAQFGDQSVWEDVYTWRFGWHPVEVPLDLEGWRRDGFQFLPAMMQAELTVPNGFTVASGAAHQQVISKQADSTTYKLSNEQASLSIPLSMGRKLYKITRQAGDVTIESYFLRSHNRTALMAAQFASKILDYYQPVYGNYRYKKLVIVESAAPWTGMAADGFVLVPSSFYKYKDIPAQGLFDRLLAFLVAHEVAHLWWGIGMPPDFARENWLSEAFANYLAYEYLEHQYGVERNFFDYDQGSLLSWLIHYGVGDIGFRQQSELAYLDAYYAGWDEAIVKKPQDVQYGNVTSTRTYEKGYWAIRALQGEIGKENLLQCMKLSFEQQAGQPFTIKQLQQNCEQVSAQSLDAFFQRWLYQATRLDLAINDLHSIRQGEQFLVTARIHNTHQVPVKAVVRLHNKNGQILQQTYDSDAAVQELQFSSDSEALHASIDADSQTMDYYRLNNYYPRKVKHAFALNDAPLDAYSIRYHVMPDQVLLPQRGTALLAASMGISGGYAPTHNWSLETQYAAGFGEEYIASRLGFSKRVNAQHIFSASASTTGYSLDTPARGTYTSLFAHQYTLFSTPPLGSSSRILLPSNVFNNQIKLRDHKGWYLYTENTAYRKEYKGAIPSWNIQYQRNDQLTMGWLNIVEAELAPHSASNSGFYRLAASSNKLFRVYPNITLNVSADARVASPQLPTPETFSFTDFNSNFGSYHRRSYASARASLSFPLKRLLETSLLDIMVIDSISGYAYTHAAGLGSKTWDEQAVQAAEAGFALSINNKTLGGIAELSFQLGYAQVLHQQHTLVEAKSGVFFRLGIGTPL